jgi:tetratricopeptide (TPR) repeat protein
VSGINFDFSITSIDLEAYLEKNALMETLGDLLDQCASARAIGDWPKLEELSIEILRGIYKESQIDEGSLKTVLQSYLSSIVGTGDFLTDLHSGDSSRYQEGLRKLLQFLENRPHHFDSIEPVLQSAHEIALLALDPTSANRNKIAKHLRQIARPDLAIVICTQILEKTRLNYYARTVLCGAYCDLEQFDKAIEAAEVGLKFSPDANKTYPLNALVRAHTLKFKSNGDLSEIERALEYGHQSIDLKLDVYAANAFVAAAIASAKEDEVEFAKQVLEKAEPQLRKVDIAALFQAARAEQALAPTAQVIEEFDESFAEIYSTGFDSLFDLVLRDEGFIPKTIDARKMHERFNAEGWFLQGLSNMPCPTCETVSLHSYRKHFKRYGKDMHYWALVCDNCQTATDSIDYDKKEFLSISSDLEANFPVADLCVVCLNL